MDKSTDKYVLCANAGDFAWSGSPAVLLLGKAAEQLLVQAGELAARPEPDSHQLAVIFAHAACDLQTEETLHNLISLRGIDYMRAVLKKSMRGQHAAMLMFKCLSGDSGPSQERWWQEWKASAKKRNEVAHRGAAASASDAAASLAACREYVNHFRRAVNEYQQRLQPPAASTGHPPSWSG